MKQMLKSVFRGPGSAGWSAGDYVTRTIQLIVSKVKEQILQGSYTIILAGTPFIKKP
ncbi:hypothetical protein [Paenibacillus sp. FSL R5-0912]|uniref:hypothetical protein n=1 Tax=Paenibacillus sp. FSL R5-0912 TaxID=1536771 RepID=UPI000AC629C5|nr:hypothetical protein [Paenibacillus sp. FSL R5-0912]